MMYIPLPIKAVENYIDRVSSPVLVAGAVIAIPSLVFHSLTGALYPADIAPWDKDPLEITGLVLFMSFMPACLSGYVFRCNYQIKQSDAQKSYNNSACRF
jgi:hypothetical protein